MSLTLGEKLRQAREEKGFTISEVAEQTRISSLYLQSIENDDYNTLPGGIFNKGFVKSFAKFVGVDEQEALDDYGRLISQTEGATDVDDVKVFRPEVLTDDRSAGSMAPTIIIAAIILALMTVGVLFLVDYLRRPTEEFASNTPATNVNRTSETPQTSPTPETTSPAPQMESLKVEFTALSEPVALLVTADGKTNSTTVAPGSSVLFEPKTALKLSYSRSLANVVQLTINDRKIALPAQPLMPRRNAIDFEINRDNLPQIWEAGAISTEVKAAEPSSALNSSVNTAIAGPTPARQASAPVSRPTPVANVNSARPAPGSSVPSRPAPPANSAASPVPGNEM